MPKILIGTGNPAKVKEYKKLLKPHGLDVLAASDLGIIEPEEVGQTFEQTAIDKAKHYYEKSGIPTLVDDGGFEIDALNGEPGVKSKRWVGREMSDEEIIREVFKRMQGIPTEQRTSRHKIVMALATPYGIFVSQGQIDGVVPERPHKKRVEGFPYHSIMYLPNYNKYWIELNKKEDEILNHRKVALEKIKDIFDELK
jgi:XTP/dITP diphosphohydrolase